MSIPNENQKIVTSSDNFFPAPIGLRAVMPMSARVEYPKIIIDGSCCETKVAKSIVTAMLDAVEARLNEVTDGPWVDANCGNDCCVWVYSTEDPEGQLAGVDSIANAKFIAHSRTDIPALVALARQQDAKLMAIRELVEMSDVAAVEVSTALLRSILNQVSES